MIVHFQEMKDNNISVVRNYRISKKFMFDIGHTNKINHILLKGPPCLDFY